MVAYSFKTRFAEPILAGTKLHTVRAPRKRDARPGEELQLYRGMRTKQCALIAVKNCVAVLRVIVCAHDNWIAVGDGYPWPEQPCAMSNKRGRVHYSFVHVHDFARRDGFEDWHEMRRFWLENHPVSTPADSGFKGVLIGWWKQ